MESNASLPSLEMLWERRDASVVLRERFGFADRAAVTAWVADVLDTTFGFGLDTCDRLVLSAGNALAWVRISDGSRMILKWSGDAAQFARLDALATLLDQLAGQGLPVSAPVAARDGRLQVRRDGVSLGLQRVLDGALLDVDDPHQVHAAGATLAMLHRGLAGCRVPEALTDATTPASLADGILQWLDARPSRVDPRLDAVLRRLVAEAGDEPTNRQLVHGDYRSANVLCRDAGVVGVLDFEEARQDLPVVELARAGVLLGTRYHDWGPVTRQARDRLRSGYESVRPLTDAESRWLAPLTLWITLMFVPDGDDPTGWAASALEQAGVRR